MVLLPWSGQGWVIEVNGEDWKFDPYGRLLDRPDPGPYELCWCGSGDKFRFCHRDAYKRPRVSNSEFLKGWEASADLEMCLHPTAPGGCSQKIIRSHTIQRMGGGLRTIALAGDVYGYKNHPSFLQKNDLRVIKPELIGTRKASTFRGFCDVHDSSLFRAAEDENFDGTQEQLGLLNFRAVARRLFGMHVAVRHAKLMLGYDGGLPPLVQREWFAIHHRELVNATTAFGNIERLKSEYDAVVNAAAFGEMSGFLVHFKGVPDFHCAEIVDHTFDFVGRRLENASVPAHLCAYTIAVDNGWVFVLSWNGPNRDAEQLCNSLLERPEESRGASVLRYAIEHTGNIFFAPRWWNSLVAAQQTALAKAMTDRLHPHYLRDPHALISKAVPPLTGRYSHATKVGRWAAP
jgi:SEC-C motif